MMSLLDLCLRHCPDDGIHETTVPGLALARSTRPHDTVCALIRPGLGVVLQGSKDVFLGGRRWSYGPSEYLMVSADLPLNSHAVEASPEAPYVGLAVMLDPMEIAEVASQAGIRLVQSSDEPMALTVQSLPAEVEDAVHRLARLLERPEDAAVLAPLISRELIYLLLRGPTAPALHRLGLGETRSVALRAIRWLRDNFSRPLRVEELAEQLSVSSSTLYHQFKSLTSTSPIQYQKLLRLQEARRLILGGAFGAADAAFEVGYASPAQFSREYKRLFGAPPSLDRERLVAR